MEDTAPKIVRCTDEARLFRVLERIDKTLPVALSARVDLLDFARRNLERGYVFAIEDEEGELARKFRVMSIPMLVVMRDGDVVETAVGYRTKENILELLED